MIAAAFLELAAHPARTPPAPAKPSTGDSGTTRTGRDIARDLDLAARRELGEGRIDRAIELLSEAVAHDPDNGEILADLTLAYLRHGDREFAEFYLNLAIRSGNRVAPSPEALAVLGDAYSSKNRLDDAITAWEAAWRFGSRDRVLRVKVNRARTELALSHGQRFLGGDHFEIFYDVSLSESFIAAVDADLDRHRLAQAAFFGVAPVENQLVILYASRRVFNALEAPDWAAGFFDGKIRVPVASERGLDEALDGLLAHELAHAYFSTVAPGRVPSWLQEGVAQYLEGRRSVLAEARIAAERGTMPALADLDRDFRQRSDRASALRAYRLSLSAVEFLIARSGEGAISCLIRDLAAGESSRAAFESAFGGDAEALEREWQAAIRAESAKARVR
jgi:tetratricopeptide (TPR) repeat protein